MKLPRNVDDVAAKKLRNANLQEPRAGIEEENEG